MVDLRVDMILLKIMPLFNFLKEVSTLVLCILLNSSIIHLDHKMEKGENLIRCITFLIIVRAFLAGSPKYLFWYKFNKKVFHLLL